MFRVANVDIQNIYICVDQLIYTHEYILDSINHMLRYADDMMELNVWKCIKCILWFILTDIDQDNGMDNTPTRRQAFIWANDDPLYWHTSVIYTHATTAQLKKPVSEMDPWRSMLGWRAERASGHKQRQ